MTTKSAPRKPGKKRGRPGRPPLVPGKHKEFQVAIRATPAQARRWSRAALRAGYSRSAWIRALCDAADRGDIQLPR